MTAVADGKNWLVIFVVGVFLALVVWLGLGLNSGEDSQTQTQTQVKATATPDPCQQTRADYDAARKFNYRGIYFATNRPLRPFDSQIEIHHRVPLEVILLHPCLFTTTELALSANLVGIPKVLGPSLHQSVLATYWNKFWSSHPNPTRAEVEAEAVRADQLYGLSQLAYRHFGVTP